MSYASQDAAAARRIAEALRAARVEVWFDQNELVGGDAWDAKIRKQIAECALFVPVISAATQARHEGYFRLEWKLAAQRTHMMSGAKAFLLPIVIDGTRDAEAHVPGEFRAVQWTRLLGGEAAEKFCARVRALLDGEKVAPASQLVAADSLGGSARATPPVYPWLEPAAAPVARATMAGEASMATPDQKSVAVLAFSNLSSDREQEYFSDGISEELLNVLAKVPGLKVTARTSAFSFKGKDVPIPEIAQKLGVAYVVEGSVRKAGDKVRITAQLIKAADGFRVWSETFTRELRDIFAVQDEIAGLIAGSLQVSLRSSGRVRTVNPEAYELFLKAGPFFARGNPAEFRQGVKLLQDSLVLDPEFAETWGLLSAGYSLAFAQTGPGWSSRDEILRLARQAAERAIDLDPEQSLGHFAQGLVAYVADFDWARAEAAMQRALALTPGDARTLAVAASLAHTVGRTSQAREMARRAVALDPLNFVPGYQLMKTFWAARDYAELEQEAQRVITIHPESPYGHTMLSYSLVLRGRAADAVQAAERATAVAYRLTSLALAYFAQGKIAEADLRLEQLKNEFGKTSGYQVAENYAFRNDRDQAFEWLEAAYRERDSGLTLITNDPFFDNLRSDARWTAFMGKLNLPISRNI